MILTIYKYLLHLWVHYLKFGFMNKQKSYEYNYADQHVAEIYDTIGYISNSEGEYQTNTDFYFENTVQL